MRARSSLNFKDLRIFIEQLKISILASDLFQKDNKFIFKAKNSYGRWDFNNFNPDILLFFIKIRHQKSLKPAFKTGVSTLNTHLNW